MKSHPSTATIAFYFLFTFLWFPLNTLTSESKPTNIIPALKHFSILPPQYCDKNLQYSTNKLCFFSEIKKQIVSLQQKLQSYDEITNISSVLEQLPKIPQGQLSQNFTNRLSIFNEIKQQIILLEQKLPILPPNIHNFNKDILSIIFNQFLTIQEILILRNTCKDFQILLQPNGQNMMIMFCKNFRSKEIEEATLIWFDLKHFLNQSYASVFDRMEMFNIKENEYALLIHYISHTKIIPWHNYRQINYPQILFDKITKEFRRNEHHKSLLLQQYYPLIIYNQFNNAWAKITKEGNVETGGEKMDGGDSDHVQFQLKNVKIIVSTAYAFAGLLDNGHVIAWGHKNYGAVIPNEIQIQLQNVKMVISTGVAFAALLNDGHVTAWGDEHNGGKIPNKIQSQLKNVKTIFSTDSAFCALLNNGQVIAWGHDEFGGVIPEKIQAQLKNNRVEMIISTDDAFCALLNNGQVVAWGDEEFGGKIPDDIQAQLENVKTIHSNDGTFAALLHHGSVFAWGHEASGGKIPNDIQTQLINVKIIIPNNGAFSTLLENGHVVSWGDDECGGKIPEEIHTQLRNNVVKMVISTEGAFAALVDDGCVFAWGFASCGGKIPIEIKKQLKNSKFIVFYGRSFCCIVR